MIVRAAVALLIATGGTVGVARAQSISVGGAVHHNLQRFAGDRSLNRLDGTSAGWMILGGARVGHWVIRGEASHDTTIRSAEDTSVFVATRQVTVHSELSHDMRDAGAVGGYTQDLKRRFAVTVLGGVSAVTVHRSFTTDAGQRILIPPSTVSAAATTTRLLDRFLVWRVEAEGLVHVTTRLKVIGGILAQPLRLKDDITGLSIRPYAGAIWRLK